jgi:DtxR family Mn-dependent transcriptional regulator
MVSNAAITDMSRKLATQGLINYEKYRSITLTENGEKIALGVIRRHRLWELFLNKVLDVPWEKVHDEAEKLEHQTSDYLINEIDKYLGYPEVDPHGDPIPGKAGNLQHQDLVCLTDVKFPSRMILRRIVEHTGETMKFLNENGIELNQEIEFKSVNNENQIIIYLRNHDLRVPFSIAEKLFIEKL